jgi:hypothetical protein
MRKVLNLATLKGKIRGLSPARGSAHAEACQVCLENKGHKNGVEMRLEGTFSEIYHLKWTEELHNDALSSWRDIQETTEEAACGIAILIAFRVTKYRYIERSVKTTGIDYWLSNKPLESSARLEVSGILKETPENQISKRVKGKLNQTNASDHTKLPACVAVVEFSQPVSHFHIKLP